MSAIAAQTCERNPQALPSGADQAITVDKSCAQSESNMSDVYVNALSGLRAAQARMDISAQNIASAQVNAGQATARNRQTQNSAGVQVAISDQGQALSDRADSLGADIVEHRSAAFAYQANLFSVRAASNVQRKAVAILEDRSAMRR